MERRNCTGSAKERIAAVRDAEPSDCKGPNGKDGLCFFGKEGRKKALADARLISYAESCK